jgi:hypothetical protein
MGDSGTAPNRTPIRSGHEQWQGPIYLPTKRRDNSNPGKFFFAKIEGETHIYDFTSEDAVKLTDSQDLPIFSMLRQSNFAAKEWHIRESANHAKAKTMTRPAMTRQT